MYNYCKIIVSDGGRIRLNDILRQHNIRYPKDPIVIFELPPVAFEQELIALAKENKNV